MYFIDNEDFITCRARFVLGVFDQIFDIIDSPVACRIHLDNIHMPILIRHNTVCTLIAGMRALSFLAEQGFGKDSGSRSFSAASKP